MLNYRCETQLAVFQNTEVTYGFDADTDSQIRMCQNRIIDSVPDDAVPLQHSRDFFLKKDGVLLKSHSPLFSIIVPVSYLFKPRSISVAVRVADSDLGSGVFLTPGSGIRDRFFSYHGSRIPVPQPIFLG